ncbi:RNA polymerase sigma factor [Streptomyces sp. NPDC059917]|uniref:RNA polymerase sigma factor n=1 Tax=Streptomyces sp. NPDC059917 TaxID=3347002 RepID=UPI00365AF7C1
MRWPTDVSQPKVGASDAELATQVRHGRCDSFRLLYRRHYPAVHGYASTCSRTPLDAFELTSQAFTQLLHRMVSGDVTTDRLTGCIRLQLLDLVRTIGVQRCVRDPGGFAPQFRQWVGNGANWSLDEGGQLAHAWQRIPHEARCLLWHTLVERDAPLAVSRFAGTSTDEIDRARVGALAAVRSGRAALYLSQISLSDDCRRAVQELMAHPDDPASLHHCYSCPDCFNVYQDVIHADTRLESQLPLALLGWWPVLDYLNLRAAIPVPLTDPPFLERAVRQAERAVGRPRTEHGRWRRVLMPNGPALAGTVFLTGLAVGALVGWVLITQSAGI